jgi:hypothetical protein
MFLYNMSNRGDKEEEFSKHNIRIYYTCNSSRNLQPRRRRIPQQNNFSRKLSQGTKTPNEKPFTQTGHLGPIQLKTYKNPGNENSDYEETNLHLPNQL